jgi:hypothetical protein
LMGAIAAAANSVRVKCDHRIHDLPEQSKRTNG